MTFPIDLEAEWNLVHGESLRHLDALPDAARAAAAAQEIHP